MMPSAWSDVLKADMTLPAGKEQQLDERTFQETQQKQQKPYKGLGTTSVVSADGEPLTRSADVILASSSDDVTAASAMEGAAASGLINSGEGGTAGGLSGRGGLPEGSNAGAGLTGGSGAGGEGTAGIAEGDALSSSAILPAKTVSMDGDIIATASKAEALMEAAAESPHVGARLAHDVAIAVSDNEHVRCCVMPLSTA